MLNRNRHTIPYPKQTPVTSRRRFVLSYRVAACTPPSISIGTSKRANTPPGRDENGIAQRCRRTPDQLAGATGAQWKTLPFPVKRPIVPAMATKQHRQNAVQPGNHARLIHHGTAQAYENDKRIPDHADNHRNQCADTCDFLPFWASDLSTPGIGSSLQSGYKKPKTPQPILPLSFTGG